MNKNQKSIDVELPEEIEYGVYSNVFLVGHSQSEFILDFLQMMPNIPKAKVKSRIIITPQQAKNLVAVLQENIKNFETEFGTNHNRSGNTTNMNFLTPLGEA